MLNSITLRNRVIDRKSRGNMTTSNDGGENATPSQDESQLQSPQLGNNNDNSSGTNNNPNESNGPVFFSQEQMRAIMQMRPSAERITKGDKIMTLNSLNREAIEAFLYHYRRGKTIESSDL